MPLRDEDSWMLGVALTCGGTRMLTRLRGVQSLDEDPVLAERLLAQGRKRFVLLRPFDAMQRTLVSPVRGINQVEFNYGL